MQPSAATLSLLALGAVLLGGCHSEPLPGDDGNSNVAGKSAWLRCDTSAACSGTESCVCGVCASPCASQGCATRGGVCVNATEQRCLTQSVNSGGVCLPNDLDNGWTGSASSSSLAGKPGDPLYNPPQNALDGQLTTSWSSGKPQAADEWYQLDFGQTLLVQSIELDLGTDASAESYDDYPRGYFVRVSDRPNDETATVIASGRGKTPITHIDLKGSGGRYVFIRQTVNDSHAWSIHELRAAVTWPAP